MGKLALPEFFFLKNYSVFGLLSECLNSIFLKSRFDPVLIDKGR